MGIAYAFGVRLGAWAALEPGGGAPIWPSSAVLLAALMLSPPRQWGVYLLAAAVGQFAGDSGGNVSWGVSAGIFASRAAETLAAAGILRRVIGPSQCFTTVRETTWYILVAALAAPMLAAFPGAVAACNARAGYWEAWTAWFMGDSLAHLALTPCILAWMRLPVPRLKHPRYMEALILAASLALVGVLVFCKSDEDSSRYPSLLYAPLPMMLWAAIRFGPRGAATATAVLALITTREALSGQGFYMAADISQNMHALQIFLAISGASFLVLASMTEERAHAKDVLAESEARYRDLVQCTNSIILRWTADGRITFLNRFALEFFGYEEHEIIGRPLVGTIVPETESSGRDLKAHIGDIPCHPEQYANNENENIRRGGERVWVAWTNKPLFDQEGNVSEVFSVGNDITARKEAENTLSSVREELERNVLVRTAELSLANASLAHEIEERKRAEEAIAHERNLLRTIIDSIPCPIFAKDLQQRFVTANECLIQELGVEPQRLFGNREDDLPVRRRLAHPLVSDADVLRSGRNILDQPICVQTNGGNERWYLASRVALRENGGAITGLVGIDLEVTQAKRAEEALRESEEKLRLIIEHAPLAVAMLDREMNYLVTSQRWVQYFHSGADSIIGRCFHEVFGGFLPENWIEACARGLSGIPERSERSMYTRASGAADWLKWEIHPWRCVTGHIDGIILFVEVITDRVRAEEEQRRLEAQILNAQKLESLGVLAGGIAHDFNNLLMSILGNADLALLDLSPVSPARDNVRDIERAARRAAELCKQMLAYSGKGRFEVQVLHINELVEEMAHLLEVSISKKAVLKYYFADNLPPIEADPTQIRQIIMNLITNASDAVGDKSGVISVNTGAIECDETYLRETFLDEQLPPAFYVYFEVADSGCGMDAETRQRIFDPFFTTKFTGRGLGLAAVLGIVRGHRGAIKVYSEPGKGTTIKVLLPAADKPIDMSRREQANARTWRGNGVVLLVDDEESVRAVGKRMLERIGFEVLTASDGREALVLCQQRGPEISCVLLDLTMPHMDGEETFRELRHRQEGIPVILTSGYNEQEISDRFAGKGLAGFIQKPYQTAQLINKLREVLGE